MYFWNELFDDLKPPPYFWYICQAKTSIAILLAYKRCFWVRQHIKNIKYKHEKQGFFILCKKQNTIFHIRFLKLFCTNLKSFQFLSLRAQNTPAVFSEAIRSCVQLGCISDDINFLLDLLIQTKTEKLYFCLFVSCCNVRYTRFSLYVFFGGRLFFFTYIDLQNFWFSGGPLFPQSPPASTLI